jgi:flagellar biosynthesis/type III secretory pathway chaperone
MTHTLERLIQLLREELQQYGEMLALLDQQQDCIITRAADDVLQTVAAIQVQSQVIEQARARRDQCRLELLQSMGLAEDMEFARLLPLLPASYRPLVDALVKENNELLTRVRHRARQNHLLLSRTVSLMQRFMSTLIPAITPTVYNGTGNVLTPALASSSMYEAVG